MERKERMFEELNLKLKNEYDKFIESIEKLSSKEIIQRCYEIVSKENLSSMVYDVELFNEKQLKFLLESNNLLSTLYNIWLDSDYAEPEIMIISVKNYIDNFLKNDKNKGKER